MTSDNTDQGGGFKPGQSGNPNGRPPGSRNRTTLAVETLLEGEADKLTRKAVEKALAGDMAAMRLCLERICPPRKDRPISIDLPSVRDADGVAAANDAVVAAVANGDITPAEGAALVGMLEARRKIIETQDLAARVAALEAASK